MSRRDIINSLPDSVEQTPDYILMSGGLDLETPVSRLKPGVLRETFGFEAAITGGYSRIKGYERFDGRPNPSDGLYSAITVNITGTIAVGNTITGGTSGATGKVIYVNLTLGLVVFTKATGAFVLTETVLVAAVSQGTVTDTGGSEATDDFDARMLNAAADDYRADILVVPGSGQMRGVVRHNNVTYAFRNNAGNTAIAIYKHSSSGWVLVPFGEIVSFTAGNSSVNDADVLTQGAVTATISRVMVESGTSPNLVGRLVITGRAGGNFAAGAATSTGGGALTLSGAQAAIAPLPSGDYEFDIETVGSQKRVYGVDQVNSAFEFDGTTYAPIRVSGASPDIPNRVLVQAGHLVLTYLDNVQISSLGTPFMWSANGGALLLASGTVTAMSRLPGSQTAAAAAVCTDDDTQILYGIGAASALQLISFSDASGAKAKTLQRLGGLFGLDDLGVTNLETSQNYGNFASSVLTQHISRFMRARRNLATGSVVVRDKNQYRVFFSDGYAVYMTIVNGKLLGAMPVQFPNVVRCVFRGETPNTNETVFFGSDDGYIYRLEAGTSFDGAAIDFSFTTVPAYQRRLRRDKHYRRLTFEVAGTNYCSFNAAVDLDFSSTDRAQQDVDVPVANAFSPGLWDNNLDYDGNLIWDGVTLTPSTIRIDGSGENIAIRVAGSSDIMDQFTINAAIVTYSLRGRKRS